MVVAGHFSSSTPPPWADPLYEDGWNSDEEDQSERRFARGYDRAMATLASAYELDPHRKHFLTIERFFFEFAVSCSPNR